MNPDVVNFVLRFVGMAFVAIGHSTVIPQPFAQVLGEIGAGMVLLSQRKPGDVAIADLPAEIQESIRPSKSP
jgi:hypothetical protein